MTPEDYVVYSGCDTPIEPSSITELFEDNLRLNQQLQAEKARADKAEEMVATLNALPQEIIKFGENWKTNYQHNKENGPYSKHYQNGFDTAIAEIQILAGNFINEQTAQAYKKRKCDEIVGKINAIKECGPSAYYCNTIIDIVKSVLGGEG